MHMLMGHRDIPVTLCMCLKGLVGPMRTVSEGIMMMLGGSFFNGTFTSTDEPALLEGEQHQTSASVEIPLHHFRMIITQRKMEERNQRMSEKGWCGRWISIFSRYLNMYSAEDQLSSKIGSSSRLYREKSFSLRYRPPESSVLLSVSTFQIPNRIIIYWVGQKGHSGFSVTSYGKTQMNFLANPVLRRV